MSIHSHEKYCKKSQFENLTFSPIVFREISRRNRTTPSFIMHPTYSGYVFQQTGTI